MTTISWVGPNGTIDHPTSGNSSDPANWSSGTIPGGSDVVAFAAGSYTVTDTYAGPFSQWTFDLQSLGAGVTFVVGASQRIGISGPTSQQPPVLNGTMRLQGGTLSLSNGMFTGTGKIAGYGEIDGYFRDLYTSTVPSFTIDAEGGVLAIENVSDANRFHTTNTIAGRLEGHGEIDLDDDTVLLGNPTTTVAMLRIRANLTQLLDRFVDRGGFAFGSGSFHLAGSTMILAGATTLSGGSIYGYVGFAPFSLLSLRSDTTISNVVTVDTQLHMQNSGTLHQSGNLLVVADGNAVARFVNTATGAWAFEGTGSILFDSTGSGTLINSGLIDKTAAAGLSAIALAIRNDGSVTAQGALDIEGKVSGQGTMTVGASATLALDAAVARTQTIGFTAGGTNETLQLGSPESFRATISGFAAGDMIDLDGFAAAGTRLKYDAASGILVLNNGTAHVALTLDGQFVQSGFHGAADAAGTGTALTYVPAALDAAHLAAVHG